MGLWEVPQSSPKTLREETSRHGDHRGWNHSFLLLCPRHGDHVTDVTVTTSPTLRRPRRNLAHVRSTTPTSGRPRPRQGDHAHVRATTQCILFFSLRRRSGDTKCNLRHYALTLTTVTVGCGVLPHPAGLDSLTSTGTSLLDYERGVPVARPYGGREARKRKELHVAGSLDHVTHVTANTSLRPRQGDHASQCDRHFCKCECH
jgi:hypothetical protein